MSIKILGASVSPFVRKVRVACAEKGIEYVQEQVSPFAPPDGWRKISPLGKIPALEHDGRIVNDSSVICAYLERIQPEPALYPSDPYDYARVLWIEEYADGGLFPIAGPKVFMPLALRPVLTRQEPSAAEVEAVEKAVREELAPLCAYLEEQLGDATYFVGDALTIADIAVATCFVNARHAGFPPDPGAFPRLARFVERVHALPSFARCIDEEKSVFGKRWK
jgi:glutathione S-transferase